MTLLLDEVRQWLRKAAEDLRTAEVAIAAGLFDPAAFHCQQAAEKSLKAFLVSRSCEFRKTHNLEELGNACVQEEPSLRLIAIEAATLTEYAWMFRYPGAPRTVEAQEAAQAISKAALVFAEVLKLISGQAHP
jgi:HEPN domain-containing protein